MSKNIPSKIAILVNKSARQGTAGKEWSRIRKEVLNYFPAKTLIIEYETPYDIDKALENMYLNEGVDGFVSAGGDGSINIVLNALMNLKEKFKKQFFLGGIALGSSNDFVKPSKNWINSIPIKIDWKNNQLTDLGFISFKDINGNETTKYFLINASLGITAQANYLFNKPNKILAKLKQYWVQGAILYAALKTILTYKIYDAILEYNGEKKAIELSNLAVIKSPYISGNLKYEQDIKCNDHFFGLNYCDDLSRFDLVVTLYELMKGKFKVSSKKKTFKIKSLDITPQDFVPIETDGEICLGKEICFRVIPEEIYVMGN